MLASAHIPLWIKVAHTLFLCALAPVYWTHYGPRNFLWFSDVALLMAAAALWLESPLLAGMTTLAIALPDVAWNADFLGRLLTGRDLLGITGYMFDPRRPRHVRALSLFHVVLPVELVWMVHRLGYDRRAWAAQSALALVLLPVTYRLTDPADNINWVYGPGAEPQRRLPPRLYLALVMLLFPLVIYLPAHLALARLFWRP
jgi:hypothetical protein